MSILRKNKNKELLEKTINPLIMEGFLNKIKDIICIANYDGTIEVINNADINNQYKRLEDFFSAYENNQLYNNILETVEREGCFIGDIELIKDKKPVRMYIAAYNIPSVEKIFFYIKDTNKYFEKEIELLEKIDRQDEYLKSKDLFIANLSHEVRTPINAIVGMIYFLKDTPLTEEQLEYVNKLEESSNILLDMVNGILDLSGDKKYTTTNTKIDFNLKKFLDEIIEMFENEIEEKRLSIYLKFDFDEDINLYADKARLSQVFVNLLENAIKYTDKGYIELEARKIEEDNICYKFQFCLKDTGIGIKKEDTLKIFREFQQVDDPTRKVKAGKGMGLAIAKKIVEDMNGKMWVESSVGLGSKFYFNIIVDKSTKTLDELKKQTRTDIDLNLKNDIVMPKTKKETVRILLVEDNKLNIEITKKLIEELNYQCDVSEDGIESIKKIKEVGNDYYDLILMDIHMPKYNGYEISKILKKDLDLKVPIIALTATSITPEIIEENSKYIVDYFQKPIKPSEFKEKIKSYIENSGTNTEEIKRHILLLGDKEEDVNYIKTKLQNDFHIVTTVSKIDTQILLETGDFEAILIDEFLDLDKEFEIIQNIKSDKIYSKIPIILIDKNNSNLKERAFNIGIEEIIDGSEIEKCSVALGTILNKLGKEQVLEKMIEKDKNEIENVYNFLFESMVNLTTSKSKETGEHLKRTQQYMKVMLEKYEEFYQENRFTSKEIIEDISMAAVLHDIGKVGIPDNILNKPDRLTDEEYEIIKSHVVIGKNILETTYGNKVSNNILTYAKDIVYHHHEKYDGTGYPENLKGEQISVISRIMALIDVYDALVNPRVYKPALPYEEVEAYIKEQSGKAFDPKVVNVFEMVKENLKKINEDNKDKISNVN